MDHQKSRVAQVAKSLSYPRFVRWIGVLERNFSSKCAAPFYLIISLVTPWDVTGPLLSAKTSSVRELSLASFNTDV